MRNKRVALYVRVSTDDQDYQRQKDELVEFCKRNSYEIKQIFEEKISGASDERKEFNKLLLLDRETIDSVCIWELSRLSRKMSGLITTIEDFSKKGISVISFKDNWESLDENGNMTPATIMMMSVSSAMVQIERDTIRERTISGRKHKILSGEISYAGTPPYGYKNIDKKFVINEPEAEIVKTIYKMYIEGNVIMTIAGVLNMSKNSIRNILTNEAYTGRKYSNIAKAYITTPSIITKEDFEKVQKKLKDNRVVTKKSLNDSPLKGKLFCGECGHMLSRHGGIKMPKWSCHCNKITIHDRYATDATETALEAYKKEMGYESTKKALIEQIKQLERKCVDMSELVDNLIDKINDERKKLEVLKDVFSMEQLQKEVGAIKILEREKDKQEHILQNMMQELFKLNHSLKNEDINESVIDKILVERITRRKKLLTYYIYNKKIKVIIDYGNQKTPSYIIAE